MIETDLLTMKIHTTDNNLMKWKNYVWYLDMSDNKYVWYLSKKKGTISLILSPVIIFLFYV